jgi:hypothetical protein
MAELIATPPPRQVVSNHFPADIRNRLVEASKSHPDAPYLRMLAVERATAFAHLRFPHLFHKEQAA